MHRDDRGFAGSLSEYTPVVAALFGMWSHSGAEFSYVRQPALPIRLPASWLVANGQRAGACGKSHPSPSRPSRRC